MQDDPTEEQITGYDLMSLNEKNVAILIERICELRDSNTLANARLWQSAGIKKEPFRTIALAKWRSPAGLNRKVRARSLGALPDRQEILVHQPLGRFCSRHSGLPVPCCHWISGHRSRHTKENIRKRARGLFRVYHPSLILKGRYVVGAAQLTSKPDSDAVSITEYFRYRPDEKTKFSFRSIDESYEGYLFRKSKKYFSLLRDRERSHMRMEMFPDTFGIDRDIKMMRGAVMSISENRGFYAPIYYEKVDLKPNEKEAALFNRLREESNIYQTEDLSEVVRAHLDSIPPSLFG